jgi:hypothetical protein
MKMNKPTSNTIMKLISIDGLELIIKAGNVCEQENFASYGVVIKDYVGDMSILRDFYNFDNKQYFAIIPYSLILRGSQSTEEEFEKRLNAEIIAATKTINNATVGPIKLNFKRTPERVFAVSELMKDFLK